MRKVSNMKLNIAERIALLNVLPPQGSLVELRIVRELQSQLAFSETEMKRFKMKNNRTPDGIAFVVWDSDFNKEPKDIKIGDVAKGIIVEQLKTLESRKMLRLEMLDLYEKFVDGKET